MLIRHAIRAAAYYCRHTTPCHAADAYATPFRHGVIAYARLFDYAAALLFFRHFATLIFFFASSAMLTLLYHTPYAAYAVDASLLLPR